jgi:hypothetical protein
LRRACTICQHPERGRIDYLIVTANGEHGTGKRALADKFGVSSAAIYRHSRNHITEEYRGAVKIGPFDSEGSLRKLCAENGATVLENFRALYNGHLSRWLVRLEAGDDEQMVRHGRVMADMLAKIGLLTKEMLPPGAHQSFQTNFFLTPDFYSFQRRALTVLRRHPEALADWLAEFRSQPSNLIEASANAA